MPRRRRHTSLALPEAPNKARTWVLKSRYDHRNWRRSEISKRAMKGEWFRSGRPGLCRRTQCRSRSEVRQPKEALALGRGDWSRVECAHRSAPFWSSEHAGPVAQRGRRDHLVTVRKDLSVGIPPVYSRSASRTLEKKTVGIVKRKGYLVKWG